MSAPRELSARRRELVEKLLRQQGSGSSRAPIVPRAKGAGQPPLSFPQERLWFLHRLEPDNPAYNITYAVRFRAAVEVDFLRQSLDEIVRRHEILRTTFPSINERPVQMVADASPLPVEVIDLASVPPDLRASELQRIQRRQQNRSFDLADGPLFVATLIVGIDPGSILLLTMHHIVMDGWSTGVLIDELRVLYDAFAGGKSSPLEPLAIQYADYAAWQRDWLRGEVLRQHLDFWRGQLADAPALELPTDRPRTATVGTPASRELLLLDPELSAGLKELSRRHAATLHMTGLAAFNVLLHRYTGQEDIVVGTPVANRGRVETERLIGFFVNMLVMRARLTPEMSFRELVAHVKAVASGAFEHEALPFETIVSDLVPTRDLGRNPIFQVTFAVSVSMPDAEAPFELNLVEADTARFDLELHVSELSGRLLLSLVYDKALFDQASVVRMLRHFEMLLRGVVADDERPIGLLAMLTDGERQALGCGSRIDHAESCETFVSAFERHVSARAAAPAVVRGHEELSYAGLDTRAGALARWLAARGVARGSIVAVCLDRGPEFVTAILGVMKAGAAYVPIDPDYPRDRIAFMLHDARASVVLTEERLRTLVEPDPSPVASDATPIEIVCLDRDTARFAGHDDVEIPAPDPDGLAYVIYTSGSTGRPKGVLVPHRGLANVIRAQAAMFGVGPGDRVLQFSSPSFDASVFDIVMALGSGATLVLADREDLLPGPGLTDLLRHERVTLLTITPSALTPMPVADLPELRTINVAGEACPAQLVDRWAGGRRFFNLYGPTEATIWATAVECFAGSSTPTIGRAIAGAAVYVVDRNLQIVPPGIPGELAIGGVGVVRGYRGRPDLTAEQFIPDPFSSVAGSRLYRSGDRARYTAAGEVEFLGRVDHQVKLRGFRIELGEVEDALRRHPDVAEAAVIVESIDDHKRLVAYVVPRTDAELPVADMARFAKDTLPLHMRPGVFVTLGALPLTPNGKLDRAALPLLGAEPRAGGPRTTEPRTDVEAALVRIWTDVLRVAHVGIHDNFFEFGGDSILSIQIVARANESGLRLTVKDLFRHQTVAELAAVVGEARPAAVSVHPATGEARLTPIQRWFFEQRFAEPHHFNQAVILEAARPVESGVVERAVRFLSERHDSLRARFRETENGWVQTISPFEDAVPFTTVDLSHLADTELSEALEAESGRLQASLSLEGPLVRVALFDVKSGQPQRLLIVVHHLAIDSVSWRILLGDFNRACEQILRGEAPAAAGRSSSADAWVGRLEESVRAESFRAEANVWIQALTGPVEPLPLDRSGAPGDNTIGSLAHVSVSLTKDETRALLQDVPKVFRTQINDALLAVLARTIADWTGGQSVLINLEGHGREELFDDIDLSQTVGWFTSACPVRLEAAQGADLLTALKRTKESLRALPHRGLGYGVLRYLSDEHAIRAAMASLPAPEIGFNYMGQYDQVLEASAAWRGGSDRIGSPLSPLSRRVHVLDVAGHVSGGCLRIGWMYSNRFHDPETIERLAGSYISGLRELIERCSQAGVRGATPSDFPLVSLDQGAVDRIVAQYPDFDSILPVSPLQQGLFVHTLRSPGDGAYVLQFSSTFEGRFDPEALRRAWQLIVDRHEQFRSAFVWRDADEPIQVVLRKIELPWEFEDWSELSPDDQARRFDKRLAEERARGFDLSVAPAMRCSVIRLGDRLHRFTWSLHHILLDGWSVQIVFRDVTEAFEAIREGREVVLPPAPAYREYLRWVRAQDPEDAKDFWKATLSGLEEPTTLSLPAPANPSPTYADLWVELPESLTEQLSSIGRQQRLTMGTIVEGAWAMLLARYTSKSDVVFGVTVAGRPPVVAGVQEMVGLFINTLPMRLQVAEGANMLTLLQQVQARQLAMRDFEYARLGEIQRWAGGSTVESLFDTMVAYENYPVRPDIGRRDKDLTLVDVRVVEQTHYPLTVIALPGRCLRLRIGYDEQRYERATVERMGRHLVRIFEQMATDVTGAFATTTLLADGERDQISSFETRRRGGYDRDATIATLFTKQAASTPDAVALRADGATLTYGELDRRSNQLARYLQLRGIAADVPVGVCLGGGFDLIVALLGVVKAGGAYLALDPTYPAARLALMIAETGAPIVLSNQEFGDRLETSAAVIELDGERLVVEAESGAPVDSSATAEHLAYISYTSGSTGQPKGVSVPHRAVVRLLFGADYAQFGPDETWLQLAPVPFDASTLEIWGALLHGGRLVLAGDRTPTPQALGDLLGSEGVTSLWLTASLYNTIIDAAPEVLVGLRQLLIGGEALSVAHVQRGLLALRHTRIINGYGPTESTTFTCCYPIPASSAATSRAIPVGTPIANTTVHVLGADMLQVPIGVPGELYIGGDGLARGYAGQTARTAERFVPDPFSRVPGRRLYRTGDLVRWTPDGLIDFLGRNDEQVKIRGYRIEPGEIGTVLESHPAVKSAAVIARQDATGVKRLVAYVVAPSLSDDGDLRKYLGSRLPDYMVPSAFVMLDSLPLTPNGKIDRDLLPEPEAVRAAAVRKPQTAAEIALAAIWAEVLRVADIGVDDNFFELAGDSILGIQICARAARAGWHVTPKQLFEHQTVAGLAAVARPPTTAPAKTDACGPIPLLPIQRWFFEQDVPDAHHFTQAVMLTVDPRVPASVIERALGAVVAHHDGLRAQFTKSADGWLARILPPQTGGSVLNHVVLSGDDALAPAAAVGRGAAALQVSLDLQQGPLVRATLFEGPAEPRLLIVIHHLVVDTVSWRILLEDLETACAQCMAGEPIALQAKTTSLRQWAERLAAHADSPSLDDVRAWWRSQAARPVARLPIDYPDGLSSNTVSTAAHIRVSLSRAETDALLQAIPRTYRTQINEVLLTALLQAAAPWTLSSSLVLDLEGHGRESLFDDVDVNRTVGWFTTIAPIQLKLPSQGGAVDALLAVKEQLRSIGDRTLKYGLLRFGSSEPTLRATLANLRAEIGFNYLGRFELGSGGLFSPAPESAGPTASPRQRRPHLLDIVGMLTDGQLHFDWLYCPLIHNRSTIDGLAQRYVAALKEFIACSSEEIVDRYTPSDFPLARIEQRTLDTLADRYRVQGIDDLYPASPLQQGMVFHSMATPNSSLFITQLDCAFERELDPGAMARAWEAVLARHPVLRTVFVVSGTADIHQVVVRHARLPWTEEDWRDVPLADQPARLTMWLREDRRRGFDMSRPPLTRIAVIRTADDRHHMVWTHHHSLLDGWSFPPVLQELLAEYGARRSGTDAHIVLRRPYRDYIAWVERRDRAAEERYWREALEGFSEPTVLATDAAPGLPPSDLETSNEQIFHLPPAATHAIEAFAQHHRLTLNTVVQGSWALLLSRYSGRDDVVFGTTVSGRPADLPGVEQMIGLFINGLPMRVRVEGDRTVGDWLRDIQARHSAMRQHEGSSVVEIQGWSDVPRGVRLFDSTYVFENYPEDAGLGSRLSDTGLTRAELVSNTSSALHLRVIPGSSLALRLVYDARRFASDDIERMLVQLASVVEQFAADADATLGSLSLVTSTDAQRLPNPAESIAAAWSGAVHEQFARTAQGCGDRVAIVDQNGSTSYSSLNQRANQLAHCLVHSGVEREEVVAVYADRSAALVLAVLGVAKSGAAFTMLDPAYPVARHVDCLRATNARAFIQATDGPLPDDLRAYLDGASLRCHVTLPDDPLLDRFSTESPGIRSAPDDLAYVAFTSGSEGQPKGVLGRHGPLAQYAGWLAKTFGFGHADRAAMLSAIPHDPLLRDIFPTLQLGATLCIPSPALMGTPGRVVDWIRSVGVTACNLTPALARLLVSDCQGAALAGLRQAFIVGEVLSPRDVASMRDAAPNATLINLYGSTEAQQALGYFILPPSEEVEPGARIPIGRGIDGVQLLVLSGASRLAGVGEVGEICVRTPYLSRGYLNDDALTRSRFRINPLTGLEEDRLYRTGDLGRYLPDGDVCFVGRRDRQVKIRGYRVEPGEVEAVILQHADVREVAVVPWGDDRDARVLAAYVVGTPSPSDLRQFLRQRLPSAMVPAHIVPLERLPRSASGKIDRRALPEPERAASTATHVAPQSPIEQTLAKFWADVLGVKQVGLFDNFFELGGHSLLAARLAARVREEFQMELPISTVFENPVLADLSLVVTRALLDGDAELAQLLNEVKDLPDDRAQAIIDDETSGTDAGVSVTS